MSQKCVRSITIIFPLKQSIDDHVKKGSLTSYCSCLGLLESSSILADWWLQVVVEGVRGISYMSDSAVDDVALLHGDDCVNPTSSPQVPSTTLATTGNIPSLAAPS